MSNTITNSTISKMITSSTKGGRKTRRTRRRKILGGATDVAVANTPHNVVSPGVTDMYKQLNQAQATNSVQSMTDGGGRRKKRKRSKKRRRTRRRSI
jgi:hypothetical protein